MIPDKILDHEGDALELLTEQFKGRPVVEGLLKVFASRAQGIEDTVWATIEARLLASCVGVWLEAYGAIVGESRNGRSDTNYRKAIALRLLVNRSKGRAVDVVAVATLAQTAATYREHFPGAWEVTMYDVIAAPEIIRLLAKTKAAGTYGILAASVLPSAAVFRFDHEWNLTFGFALPTNPGYLPQPALVASTFTAQLGTVDSYLPNLELGT